MTQRLNITNGDSAVGTLSEAGIAGKIIAWRDVLHEGPVDSSLPLNALSKQRARFISERGWGDFAHVSGDFAERDRVIQHLDYFGEVVLWFEDDLYDQLQMIQLLDFFSRGSPRRTKLTLILVDGYIPPLSASKLKQLDDARAPVTAEQFALAQRAWKAFGSDDPLGISRLLDENTSALPHLAAALRRHLEEFPSITNGLSRSEREALTAIGEGHTTPVAAFLEVGRKQESIFLGDIVFYSYLERLSGKKNPLVTWSDGSAVVSPTTEHSREFVKRELAVTPLGREVLSGRKDWLGISTQSRWLGGVEIKPGAKGWRWDSAQDVLVSTGATKKKTARPSAKKRAPRKKK
ncbi:MAG TPA: DUF1835 domain-containing protein [Gemmatimonadaceae bacterium]|nr:DUF1835 domain-containing protein [Gemmatimonadaceae bacterium]